MSSLSFVARRTSTALLALPTRRSMPIACSSRLLSTRPKKKSKKEELVFEHHAYHHPFVQVRVDPNPKKEKELAWEDSILSGIHKANDRKQRNNNEEFLFDSMERTAARTEKAHSQTKDDRTDAPQATAPYPSTYYP